MNVAIVVAGVDLSGGGRRTGIAIAVFEDSALVLYETRLVEPLEAAWLLSSLGAYIVAVDSPLSHPTLGVWRRIDLLGKRLGLRLLPPGWRGMAKLVARALEARRVLEGAVIVETHPSSVLRVSGCKSVSELVSKCFDASLAKPTSRHEEDAVIAACVAACVLRGCAARIEAVDGSIWLIDPSVCG